jgi:hypothetical protein
VAHGRSQPFWEQLDDIATRSRLCACGCARVFERAQEERGKHTRETEEKQGERRRETSALRNSGSSRHFLMRSACVQVCLASKTFQEKRGKRKAPRFDIHDQHNNERETEEAKTQQAVSCTHTHTHTHIHTYTHTTRHTHNKTHTNNKTQTHNKTHTHTHTHTHILGGFVGVICLVHPPRPTYSKKIPKNPEHQRRIS